MNINATEFLISTPPTKGNKSKTSISKIKKIIATKKKRKEKGNRLSSLVENPHSKGLHPSRSNLIFFDSTLITATNKIANTPLTEINETKLKIFLFYS